MSSGSESRQVVRLPPPSEVENLECPRCNSTNTRFCYYNNYNTSQPRHFCKSCRRYWTRGGTLRNVPIGGATRKSSKKGSHSDLPISSPPPATAAGDPITTIPAAPITPQIPSASASASAQSLVWPLNMQRPRLVPYGRLGLEMEVRPVFGETGFAIWAVEEGGQVNGDGRQSLHEASSACNTWQIGGVDADCCGRPILQPPK